ncbi:MAG: hypothetical protein SVM80_06250 [Halobacteriota archaeon]|nr:hypothetical protein [Halobacteriota archaeon]
MLSSIVAGIIPFWIPANDEVGKVSGNATIKFIDLEGGFYGVIGDNGEQYDPIYLPVEFQVDGLQVRFEARIRDDLISTHMWGTPIELTGIGEI